MLARLRSRFPAIGEILEAATLFCLTAFFLFYGLVPIFGGDGLGLVGADEPRYAQVAREMLARRDYVTPVLWGHPWLEKPALYYWRAMFAFREFGVHDWSARLPSASFAFMLVVLIYLHIRRFRNGGQLDAALITASCAAILSFARGASTDMQLAAPFCIGMLGWYAWYETGQQVLALRYLLLCRRRHPGQRPGRAASWRWSSSASSPACAASGRCSAAASGGPASSCISPWCCPGSSPCSGAIPPSCASSSSSTTSSASPPTASSTTSPSGITCRSCCSALTPWAVIAVTAFVDAIGGSINEWKARRAKVLLCRPRPRRRRLSRSSSSSGPLVPIVFFSFSESKLPGYILPAVPPLTILAGDYLNRIRNRGLKPWLLVLHAVLTGILSMFVLLMPLHLHNPEAIPPRTAIIAAGMVGLATVVFILITVARFGLTRLRIATMTPMVILLLYIFGIGPLFGIAPAPNTKHNINLMDMTYSARPLAQILNQIGPVPGIVAVYRVRRDTQYGLSFYRNQRTVNYDVGISVSDPPPDGPGPHGVIVDEVKEGSSAEQMGMNRLLGDDLVAVNGQPVLNAADFDAMRARWKPGVRLEFEVLDPRIPNKEPQFARGIMQDGVPDQQHLLVIPQSCLSEAPCAGELHRKLAGRQYDPLFTYPAQNLVVYEVMASHPRAAVHSR